MNTYSDKTNGQKASMIVPHSANLQKSNELPFQLKDNRPEAQVYENLKQLAIDNTQVSQLQSMQNLANNANSPIQLQQNNTGLPNNLKSGIEQLSGFSMNDVKVHYNSDKPAQLQAHAYAKGTDIHLASGQEKHLPHEAWHVVQQKQGRVQPTKQLKGKVNINDNAGLEKEADVMGEKAMQLKLSGMTQYDGKLDNLSPSSNAVLPIQAKFISLSEERIKAINDAAKLKGENIDVEYLQGLFISKDDESEDPELYFKVIKLSKFFFTGKEEDKLGSLIPLFARVDSVEDAEKAELALKDNVDVDKRLNVQQLLMENLELWDQNENGPVNINQISDNANKLWNPEKNANKKEQIEKQFSNDIIGNVLTGGLEEDAGGGYGAIEFRFKAAKGNLYLLEGYDEQAEEFKEKYPQLNIIFKSKQLIKKMYTAYLAAELPYRDERVSNDYLFIEESLIDQFRLAYEQLVTGKQITKRNTAITVNKPSDGARLPNAPLAVPKKRDKKYTYRATRGSRDTGQKSAMSNFSAYDYVKRFSPLEADNYSWEWLHVQGSRLGGPNRPENLVAGTADANTHMIPYERAVFELSSVATYQKPVDVTWQAAVRKDADGNDTHIGGDITIDVKFPNGAPPETDKINPTAILSLFPGKFSASDGTDFTKRDRDLLENIKEG